MFRTVPLSIISSFSLYTQQWYMYCWCVQWKTPDDGQRNCLKHVEFYSKNKFEKLVHLVGFYYHDARSAERQTRLMMSGFFFVKNDSVVLRRWLYNYSVYLTFMNCLHHFGTCLYQRSLSNFTPIPSLLDLFPCFCFLYFRRSRSEVEHIPICGLGRSATPWLPMFNHSSTPSSVAMLTIRLEPLCRTIIVKLFI